ncbi:MAG: hypothetical protein V4694_04920 [Pseudomonadota bacterium]
MKIIKFFSLFTLLISLISCDEFFLKNRFAKSEDWFYFGEYSGDFDKECRERHIGENIDKVSYAGKAKPYKNGVHMTRACANYDGYLCRINITCKKYSDEQERKRCELDAGNHWLPNWENAHNNLKNKVEISKKVCEAQANKCNSAPKGDRSCLK